MTPLNVIVYDIITLYMYVVYDGSFCSGTKVLVFCSGTKKYQRRLRKVNENIRVIEGDSTLATTGGSLSYRV
jgi:hypothetical protein